nr:MAG TPA: hypothetical protein [Caudoviricetes sp.]DAV79515.1 MAG TPA: hypothetical protein [Caudoviricetes sp.]
MTSRPRRRNSLTTAASARCIRVRGGYYFRLPEKR